MVIRVRNQNEYRLVIYIKNTLCPGKHRKKKLGTLSHMAHISPHIVGTMSSSIFVPEQINLPTHYPEFQEKSRCLTSHFYLIIVPFCGTDDPTWLIDYNDLNLSALLC